MSAQLKTSLSDVINENSRRISMLDTVKSWLRQITEVGLLLIAAAIVLEIIFGSAVPYIGVGILDNVVALTAKLGQDGLVGIIAIGIIVWLYMRR
tara:strand:+ start:124 stop:408 length:285 start_codon:yes stop_codon:yes gene_type:complete